MLFYVRRHTCADGSFEWYVLNGNTGGARAKPFRREQRRQRSARSCRRGSTWPRQKCLGERRKADRGNPRRRRVLYGIGFPHNQSSCAAGSRPLLPSFARYSW